MSSTSNLSWPQVKMTIGKLESCLSREDFTTLGQAPEHRLREAVEFLSGEVDIVRFSQPETLELLESQHNLRKLFASEEKFYGAWTEEVLFSQVSNRKTKFPAVEVKFMDLLFKSRMSDIERHLNFVGASSFGSVKSALSAISEIYAAYRGQLALYSKSNLFYFTVDDSFKMIDVSRIRERSEASLKMFDGLAGWSLTLTDGTIFERTIVYGPGTRVFYL